jgi:hypothetical protein
MSLLSLLAGVALGAAFSPFWMMVWGMVKGWFKKEVTTVESVVAPPTVTPTATK